MASAARLLGVFNGHQTVAKVSDEERKRLKVTDERGSSGAGVDVGDDVPTGPWLILLPSSTNTCMLFLGKTHVCYFRTLASAGAFSSCLTFGHKQRAQLGSIAFNVFLVWSRCLCTSTVFLTVSSLFHIYSSLIKSYLQAWGRCRVVQFASLLHIPSISLFNCQNNFVSLALIHPNFLHVCGFSACIRLCCQQTLRQLPWPSRET